MKKWSSYTVNSPTDIVHHASHPMSHHREFSPLLTKPTSNGEAAMAANADTKTRAIFVLAAKQAPYNVYGNPFYDHAGHGNVFAVNKDGGLDKNVQNYEYQPNSAIHGMVFDPTETYLYSADMWANKIWTHKKGPDGQLTLVGSLEAPSAGDHPRWVAIHPSGHYLYALMEAGNNLAVYVIDEQTHLPIFTHLTYPLIPSGKIHSTLLFEDIADQSGLPPAKKMYRSDVVFVNHSGNYLFATARSNDFGVTGYISAFRLGPVGNIEKQLFINPTPTSGGHSNAVSPCDWSDEFLALTDDQDGYLEIYRWKDEHLARVARCQVKEPGFGMNAIWYD